MGQQQLLLLVLATIIVGSAIVVGIRAFQENSARANLDALTQDILRVASDVMLWKQRPEQFGGQKSNACKADPKCFNGLTFKALGYKEKGNPFRWDGPNGDVIITERHDGLGIRACNTMMRNRIEIVMGGMNPDSMRVVEQMIGTAMNCISSS